MDLLMVLIALIGIAVSIANKKNTAKAKQQRAATQQREAAGGKPAAAQGTPPRTSPAKAPAPSKYPPIGPSKRTPAAAPKQQPRAAEASYGGTPRYTHVVTSTLEGGHTHTESSMTGEEACPPPKASVVKQPEAEPVAATGVGGLLSFQPDSVLQGVLFAEILGKPKSQR